ncbi:MAG: alkaline phosphatase family protein, partial [Candidatus Acidiferrales bacterium]
MRTAFRLSLLVTLLAAVASGQAQNPAERAEANRGAIRHVIVISIDGLMPEAYLAPDKHGLKVPTLREIVAHGAVSDGALSVFPTLTYPAHTSI